MAMRKNINQAIIHQLFLHLGLLYSNIKMQKSTVYEMFDKAGSVLFLGIAQIVLHLLYDPGLLLPPQTSEKFTRTRLINSLVFSLL